MPTDCIVVTASEGSRQQAISQAHLDFILRTRAETLASRLIGPFNYHV